MAYRLAAFGLGLVSLMGPAAMAAPVMDVVYATEYATKVVTVPAGGATAAPAPAPQQPAPAPQPAKQQQKQQQQQQQQSAPQAQSYGSGSNSNSGSSNTGSSNSGNSGSSSPSSSSSSSSNTDSGNSGNKKGLSYTSACDLTPGAHFAFDWTDKDLGAQLNGATFVPMMKDQSKASSFNAGSAPYCMAMNEPDKPESAGGSNMQPGPAAQLYKGTFESACGGKKGAPAVTSQGLGKQQGMSLDWLQQFMDSCSDCKIDFWPMHFYGMSGDDTDLQNFKDYISSARQMISSFAKKNSQAGTDMWFTEIGTYGGDYQGFLQKMITEMDKPENSDIKAYFPFMGGNPNDSGSEPTQGSITSNVYKAT